MLPSKLVFKRLVLLCSLYVKPLALCALQESPAGAWIPLQQAC